MVCLVEEDVHVIRLEKNNGEQYLFIFPDDRTRDVLYMLGHWAANKELSFTWTDAAQISSAIRGTQ